MIKRFLTSASKYPITVTASAWNKMTEIAHKQDHPCFLFSATSGGCNGFNYKLHSLDEASYEKVNTGYSGKFKPTILTNNNINLLVDPMTEMILLGTTIDYTSEDYENGIFENKFVFMPDGAFASSCGCGISFTVKD